MGKSLFAWWCIRSLADLGYPILYQAKRNVAYLFEDGRVLSGRVEAFDYLLDDPKIW